MRLLFWVRGVGLLLCIFMGVSTFEVVPYATNGHFVLLEEVQNLEEMEREKEMVEEEVGELLALWEDKERLSKWVFALGIFWFTGNYIKWMKKAFAVKK